MNNIWYYVFLLVYSLAFAIGISTFFFALLYYLLERVMWLRYYLIFLILFALLLATRALRLFTSLAVTSLLDTNLFNTILFFALSLAVSFMLYAIPAFLYNFLQIKWTKKHNFIFLSLSIIYFIMSIIGILIHFLSYVAALCLFYIVIISMLITGFANYKNIVDKSMRLIVKLLGFVTIIIMPLFMLQVILSKKSIIEDVTSIDVTLSLFYIWWNAVMLGYFFWHFLSINRVAKTKMDSNILAKQNVMIEILTKREREISEYLLKGKSNKEVSVVLKISLNTVNNHVANIYDKMEVKNRVELVNKLANSKANETSLK